MDETEVPLSSSWSSEADPPPGSQVPSTQCPVCSAAIPQQLINKHLDWCLTRGEKIGGLRSSQGGGHGNKMKPVSEPVYALMTTSNLRQRLKKCHLSTKGSRDQLVKRHQEFTHAYNSQCDSPQPKSAKDIAKEVEAREKTRNQLPIPGQNTGDAAGWEDNSEPELCVSSVTSEEVSSVERTDIRVTPRSPSPAYSDVSISRSVSCIFPDGPDLYLHLSDFDSDSEWMDDISTGKQTSCYTEGDAATALALGERMKSDEEEDTQTVEQYTKRTKWS